MAASGTFHLIVSFIVLEDASATAEALQVRREHATHQLEVEGGRVRAAEEF